MSQKKKFKTQRIHKKIKKLTERPRLVVFRSNKNITAQIINNQGNKVITAASSVKMKDSKDKTKTEIAQAIGKKIAQQAIKQKIKKVTFDRGAYKYHGRVKALAEAARKAGLDF
jgi:large subunit ribosomal protein L18